MKQVTKNPFPNFVAALAVAVAVAVSAPLISSAQGSADTQCSPSFYYVGGFGGSIRSNSFQKYLVLPAIEGKKELAASGINITFFSHLQRTGSDGLCERAMWGSVAATATCGGILALTFPPAVPACLAFAAGGGGACIYADEQDELEEKILNDLVKDDNPIVLIGYSWGGDTAAALADKFGSLVSGNLGFSSRRFILVTLDPVSLEGPSSRQKHGLANTSWINVYSNAEQGRCNTLARMGKRWGWASNADVNIDVNEFRSSYRATEGDLPSDFGHCATGVMYDVAQDHIEEKLRDYCGPGYQLPKCRIVNGKCVFN